jgi:hypothetical protein
LHQRRTRSSGVKVPNGVHGGSSSISSVAWQDSANDSADVRIVNEGFSIYKTFTLFVVNVDIRESYSSSKWWHRYEILSRTATRWAVRRNAKADRKSAESSTMFFFLDAPSFSTRFHRSASSDLQAHRSICVGATLSQSHLKCAGYAFLIGSAALSVSDQSIQGAQRLQRHSPRYCRVKIKTFIPHRLR